MEHIIEDKAEEEHLAPRLYDDSAVSDGKTFHRTVSLASGALMMYRRESHESCLLYIFQYALKWISILCIRLQHC